MKWQQFVMDEFLRIEDELGQVFKGADRIKVKGLYH